MVQLFVYAARQVPVGVMLDRLGAKKRLITAVVTSPLIGASVASLSTVALIGIVLDLVAPGGPST